MPYNKIIVKKNKVGSEIEHCGEYIFQWFVTLADVMPENDFLLLRNEAFEGELDAEIEFQSKEPITAEEFGDIIFEEERWYPGKSRIGYQPK